MPHTFVSPLAVESGSCAHPKKEARIQRPDSLTNCYGSNMARPKEFDRDEALRCAMDVFANNGYGGTSTEELRAAMGIGRQSFYDTFVSKHALYVEALQRYNHDQATQIVQDLHSGSTPIEGLSRVFSSFVDRCEHSANPTCLGTNAICEFGRRDAAITGSSKAIAATLLKPLVSAIRQAQSANEVRGDIDPDLAAHFLLSFLGGLKISARAGMPADQLRKIGCLALQALT